MDGAALAVPLDPVLSRLLAPCAVGAILISIVRISIVLISIVLISIVLILVFIVVAVGTVGRLVGRSAERRGDRQPARPP